MVPFLFHKGMDAGQLLKPALARGAIQVLGLTTFDEYRKHIETDPALERRFQPVVVDEVAPDDCLEILRGVKARYESHHKVRYTKRAIEVCVQLSKQYIADRYLPDKAIDLLDEAGAQVALAPSSSTAPPSDSSSEVAEITAEIARVDNLLQLAKNSSSKEEVAELTRARKVLQEELQLAATSRRVHQT